MADISRPLMRDDEEGEMEDEGTYGLGRNRSDTDPPVHDKFQLVYLILFLMGVTSVLPWNFFITAAPYFQYKLRNATLESDDHVPSTYKTELQVNFESSLALASQLPNAIGLFLNTFVLSHRIHLNTRLVVPLISISISFLPTLIFTVMDTDKWQLDFYWVTLATVVIINACSAILQGAVFGLAAILPNRYTQAAMSGQGAGGIFAALCSITTIAVAAGHTEDSALAYFIIVILVLVITLLSFYLLRRCDYFHYFFEKSKRKYSEMRHQTDKEVQYKSYSPPFLLLFKKMYVHMFGAFSIFFVTLSIFPGFASLIISTHSDKGHVFADTYFIPVVCFLLFNVSDTCGRVVAGFLPFGMRWRNVIIPLGSMMRFALIPLYLYTNAHPRHHGLPVYFDSDVYPIVFMMMMGVSNGYMGTVIMMQGPRMVINEYAETAGSLMVLSLVMGLAAGSAFSLAVVKFI